MAIHVEELNQGNCKSYLLVSDGEAVLVDPVREHLERYRRTLRERGLKLRYIVETHTHADHLSLGRDEKQLLGAPIVMSSESPSPVADEHISEGDEIGFGSDALRVLATPGHTPDSLSYAAPGLVLTGDALLIGGSGRTDFPGGDPGASYDSVVGKLFELPADTVVWPAHDYRGKSSSTIGAEKVGNPRFAGKSRDAYIEIMNNLGLPFPDRIQQVLQVNQSGFESDEVGGFPMVPDVATVEQIEAAALADALGAAEPPLVVDVREPEEFVGELGHIAGALLVPMDALQRRLPKLAGYVDRPIVVVCRAGARSASACAILRTAGFGQVKNLSSGMLAWQRAGLPVQR
jgi:glyoxylase-like metal-dependent hydrolase (beta-lactamase superfamily II)/rhodanese-related sulfurtransferase